MEKLELVVAALQERMGQLVVGYETQIALLRAEITQFNEKEKAKSEYAKELDTKINGE